MTLIDGKALFVVRGSARISRDHAPEANLITKPGSWAI